MRAPEAVGKVYLLTFEYAGLVKVGGLGEAVRQYATALARRGVDVTVLMPSHGRHLDPNRGFPLSPLDFRVCGDRRGLDGRPYPYCLGAEGTEVAGVKVVMFKGLDTATGLVFDRWYPYENVEEKAALFARAVVSYAERYGLPDLIHANDWHSGLAGIALRDYAERKGLAIPLVYTIHLSSGYSFPWHYTSAAVSYTHQAPSGLEGLLPQAGAVLSRVGLRGGLCRGLRRRGERCGVQRELGIPARGAFEVRRLA
jgi:Glycogen synthase